jgi:hypothetical protein
MLGSAPTQQRQKAAHAAHQRARFRVEADQPPVKPAESSSWPEKATLSAKRA